MNTVDAIDGHTRPKKKKEATEVIDDTHVDDT
jgi:hypothetical protein